MVKVLDFLFLNQQTHWIPTGLFFFNLYELLVYILVFSDN